jgi:hypothetical protein
MTDQERSSDIRGNDRHGKESPIAVVGWWCARRAAFSGVISVPLRITTATRTKPLCQRLRYRFRRRLPQGRRVNVRYRLFRPYEVGWLIVGTALGAGD